MKLDHLILLSSLLFLAVFFAYSSLIYDKGYTDGFNTPRPELCVYENMTFQSPKNMTFQSPTYKTWKPINMSEFNCTSVPFANHTMANGMDDLVAYIKCEKKVE